MTQQGKVATGLAAPSVRIAGGGSGRWLTGSPRSLRLRGGSSCGRQRAVRRPVSARRRRHWPAHGDGSPDRISDAGRRPRCWSVPGAWYQGAPLDLSVRELIGELAGISETVLLYQGERGLPRAHSMLTETTPVQDKLINVFGLARYAPRR